MSLPTWGWPNGGFLADDVKMLRVEQVSLRLRTLASMIMVAAPDRWSTSVYWIHRPSKDINAAKVMFRRQGGGSSADLNFTFYEQSDPAQYEQIGLCVMRTSLKTLIADDHYTWDVTDPESFLWVVESQLANARQRMIY